MGAFGALKVLAVATFGTSALAGSAAAAVDVCNEFKSGPIAVAMARIEADRVYVRGWYRIESGQCLRLDGAAQSIGRYSFWAIHEASNTIWPKERQGVLHCVKDGAAFTVRYPVGTLDASKLDCGEGFAKRNFVPVEPEGGHVFYTFE